MTDTEFVELDARDIRDFVADARYLVSWTPSDRVVGPVKLPIALLCSPPHAFATAAHSATIRNTLWANACHSATARTFASPRTTNCTSPR